MISSDQPPPPKKTRIKFCCPELGSVMPNAILTDLHDGDFTCFFKSVWVSPYTFLGQSDNSSRNTWIPAEHKSKDAHRDHLTPDKSGSQIKDKTHMGKKRLQKSLLQDLIPSSCKCQSWKVLCKEIAWMYYGPWLRLLLWGWGRKEGS